MKGQKLKDCGNNVVACVGQGVDTKTQCHTRCST